MKYLLIQILHILRIVFFKMQRCYFLFLYFFLPNLRKIINGKMQIEKRYPICEQLTRITGLGRVEIGDNCFFGFKMGGFHKGGEIELQARYKNAVIRISNNVATNNNIFIVAAKYIEIGDDTLIGQNVTIMDHEAHGINPDKRRQTGEIGTVIIGKNVWLGNYVTILKNSNIGDNTIVATGAVVSGIFPANVIIGGVPAKIIKTI